MIHSKVHKYIYTVPVGSMRYFRHGDGIINDVPLQCSMSPRVSVQCGATLMPKENKTPKKLVKKSRLESTEEMPVVKEGAEPQEGGGIARAWIENPKVYPGSIFPVNQCPNDGGRAREDSGGYRR